MNVPKVSEFFGISIYFYYEDHAPPHFHARCAGSDAMFTIDTVALLEGGLQRIAERRVQEWARMHRDDLHRAWQQAQAHELLDPIEPLR